MWFLPALLACAGSPESPPTAPSTGPVEIAVEAGALKVAGQPLATTRDLLMDPTDGLFPPLIEALDGVDAARVRVDEEASWLMVRKLLNSADRAAVQTVTLSSGDRSWAPSRPVQGSWRPGCPEDARLAGVSPAWTVQVQRGASGVWALATVRFRPLIASDGPPVPMENLDPSCWAPAASCDALGGVAREACLAGQGGPARVGVAGEWGCLLPIAKAPGDEGAWSAKLAGLLAAYEVTADHDVMLIPEATVPFSAVAAVLEAFALQDQPSPTLGQLLVEGNDGPPMCDLPIRDRDALERAAGRWLAGALAHR